MVDRHERVRMVEETIDQPVDLPEFTDEVTGEAPIGTPWPFAGIRVDKSQLVEPCGDCGTRRGAIGADGVEQEVVDRPRPIIQALFHQLLSGVDDGDLVGVFKLSGWVLRGSRIRHNAGSSLLRYPVFDVVVRLPRDAQFFAKLRDRFAVTNGIEICDLSALV